MRVLIFLEPCVFRDDPMFLAGHYEGLIQPLVRALARNNRLAFLGIASNIRLALEGMRVARDVAGRVETVKLYPIYNNALLRDFEFDVGAYAADVFAVGDHPPRSSSAFDLVSAIISDADPDVVLCTSQHRYLTMLAARSGFKLVSSEFGPLPRHPFPLNRFVSLHGHISEGPFSSPEALLAAVAGMGDLQKSEVEGLRSLDDFRGHFARAVAAHPAAHAVKAAMARIRERAGTVSLLALQPEQWITWEGALGGRHSPASIVWRALSELRTDKLIVSFHPDPRGLISDGTMREIWLSDPRLEILPVELASGLSELFLLEIDELFVVSSNLALAAFLLGKRVRSIGKSYASTLEGILDRGASGDVDSQREGVLRLVATRLTVDDHVYTQPELMGNRLASLLELPGAQGSCYDLSNVALLGSLQGIHDTIQSHPACAISQLLAKFGRHAIPYVLRPGAVGAEFGVAQGYFSESLLRSGRFLRLMSIDRWSDHHDDAEFAVAAQRLSQFGTTSRVVRSTFEQAIQDIPDASLDFVYVDGYAHTGDDANILRACLSKLRPGAVVSVHDYDQFAWPENFRRLRSLMNSPEFRNVELAPGVMTGNDEDVFPSVIAVYDPSSQR